MEHTSPDSLTSYPMPVLVRLEHVRAWLRRHDWFPLGANEDEWRHDRFGFSKVRVAETVWLQIPESHWTALEDLSFILDRSPEAVAIDVAQAQPSFDDNYAGRILATRQTIADFTQHLRRRITYWPDVVERMRYLGWLDTPGHGDWDKSMMYRPGYPFTILVPARPTPDSFAALVELVYRIAGVQKTTPSLLLADLIGPPGGSQPAPCHLTAGKIASYLQHTGWRLKDIGNGPVWMHSAENTTVIVEPNSAHQVRLLDALARVENRSRLAIVDAITSMSQQRQENSV